MAEHDYTKQFAPNMGGTWGNFSREPYFIPRAAYAVDDTIAVRDLEEGTWLHDATLYIEDNLAAGTISLGYRYKDPALAGSNDLTYFFSAQTTAAAGRFRASTNKPPIRLVDEAELVITVAGAIFPITNQLVIDLEYNFEGHQ